MTVSTSDNKVILTGNGSNTLFQYTFKALSADDIDVYLDDTLQVSGYTVTPDSDFVGGDVVITPAPANGVLVTLYRNVPLTQETDLGLENDLAEQNIEKMSDKLTMICQQLKEQLDRSITLPVTSSISGLTLPEPDALEFLRWNAAADALENVSINTTGGTILGPATSTANNIPLWNSTDGTILKDGVAPDTAGYVLTDNGPGNAPTFQASAGGDYLATSTKSGTWANNTAGTAVEYPVDCTSDSTLNLAAATGSRNKTRVVITTGSAKLTINGNGNTINYPTGATTQITMQGANKGVLDLQDVATNTYRVV